jgi:hypothetical protein
MENVQYRDIGLKALNSPIVSNASGRPAETGTQLRSMIPEHESP